MMKLINKIRDFFSEEWEQFQKLKEEMKIQKKTYIDQKKFKRIEAKERKVAKTKSREVTTLQME